MVEYKKHLNLEIFDGVISKHQYPWHFHNSYTIIIVEKGVIDYEFQTNEVKVSKNEVLIIAPFVIHRNSISELTTYKAIFIPQEYFGLEIETTTSTQLVNHPKIIEKVLELFTLIKLKGYKTEITNCIFEIEKIVNKIETNKIRIPKLGNTETPMLNYDATINELSKKAFVSKFHFQRKFKKNYGLTIGQLKQQEKTIKAKNLLDKGKSSTDVAYELGFFDQSHFIKYFKKMWATTPKSY